jgi:UDP-3-O-[3-hydroxymyristoyl] glucosamine N-acyltransferase
VGIAGSTKIGKNCIIAGQVGIAGHLEIADNTTLGAQAGVIGKIRKSGQVLLGSPAIAARTFMKAYALFKRSAES